MLLAVRFMPDGAGQFLFEGISFSLRCKPGLKGVYVNLQRGARLAIDGRQ